MASMKPLFRPQPLRSAISAASKSTGTTSRALQCTIQSTITSGSTRAASSTPSFSTPGSTGLPTKREIPEVPPPTPFVPDVPTFLKVIGRGLGQHASKIPDWETLFTLTSEQMRELGIEPPRARKYLIRWRQRFREGQFGIGGDLQHVTDGEAALRVLELDQKEYGYSPKGPVRKLVVNVPAGKASVRDCDKSELSRVIGYQVENKATITGPYAMPIKDGEGARVVVTEGMWEDKRGRKIDGGERRQTELRYKRRVAERREMRERGEIL